MREDDYLTAHVFVGKRTFKFLRASVCRFVQCIPLGFCMCLHACLCAVCGRHKERGRDENSFDAEIAGQKLY